MQKKRFHFRTSCTRGKMLFLILLAIIGLTAVRAQSDGCPAVRIEGTRELNVASGRYEVLPSASCSDRNVYKQKGGNTYMFYISEKWLVGYFICNLTVLFQVDDNIIYPEDIDQTWSEYDSDKRQFTENPKMEVNCDGEFDGCSDLALSESTRYESYNGQYEVLPLTEMCYGRYTYKHVSESYYMFALDSWYVGNVNCEKAVIKFYDGAFYPEDITNVGTEYTGTAWTLTGVNIACYDPSKTTTTTTTTEPGSAGELVHVTTYVTFICLLVALVGSQT